MTSNDDNNIIDFRHYDRGSSTTQASEAEDAGELGRPNSEDRDWTWASARYGRNRYATCRNQVIDFSGAKTVS